MVLPPYKSVTLGGVSPAHLQSKRLLAYLTHYLNDSIIISKQLHSLAILIEQSSNLSLQKGSEKATRKPTDMHSPRTIICKWSPRAEAPV